MSNSIQAAFSVVSWDEKTWDGKDAQHIEGRKLTEVVATYRYEGDMLGESVAHYTMSYIEDKMGEFVAIEAFTGRVHGKSGTFVMRHTGTFDVTSVRASITVVPGSGTDALAGMAGTTEITLEGHRPSYAFALDYELKR